jgi:hypothetical protein
MTFQISAGWAVVGATLFWALAGAQQYAVRLRTGNADHTMLALVVMFGPAFIHVLVLALWIRNVRTPGRLLGAVDVAVGLAFLGVMAFETMTSAEWLAFWQLAYGAPQRLVWALALVVLGACLANWGPRTRRSGRRLGTNVRRVCARGSRPGR